MAKKKGKKNAAITNLPEGQKILDITPEELEQMDPKTRGKALKRLGNAQEQDRADHEAMLRYRPPADE